MVKKVISWSVTIGVLLVITGFIISHGLSGTFHSWLSWSSSVYHWVANTGHNKGPVDPLPPNFKAPHV